MASSSSTKLLALIFFTIAATSTAASTPSFRPKALVLPITKDRTTSQYLTHIKQRTPLVDVPLVIDLGGQYLWVDCDSGYVSSSYTPVRCGSAQCSLSQSKSCGDCFNGPKPGCNNNTCGVFPYNSATRLTTVGELTQDVVTVHSTDGSNPGRAVSVPKFLFGCGSPALVEGLAKGARGMAGLGRGKVGMPSLLAAAFTFQRKFAVCLAPNGVVFFGNVPYHFLPKNDDVSKSLLYTPLLVNPVSTAGSSFEGEKSTEYFIGVKALKVNGNTLKVNGTLLDISSAGRGGTKISTVTPYTIMDTSLYKLVTTAFKKELKHVPTVTSVSPFSLCYNTASLPSTRVGLGVPQIDLVLQSSSVYWRIFGANSMVEVSEKVVCLGIVDGGVDPVTSIVIGAHQIENNLLEFDLAASKLGFSSSLLFRQTTCSNFNSTSTA